MSIYRIAVAAVIAFAAVPWSNAALARNPLVEPVLLVATPGLHHQLFGASVLIVTPLPSGEHVGFFVNRPTQMKLSEIFPDHAPSKKVTEPVFLGGTENVASLFALVRRKGPTGTGNIQLASDLYLEIERDKVDGVIETEHEHARFFAGIIAWQPGELAAEIRNNFWYVQDADAEIVLRKSTQGLWEEMIKRVEQGKYGITVMNAVVPVPRLQRALTAGGLREP